MSLKRFIDSHHLCFWGLFIAAFALRGWGLAEQPPLDDEVAAASSAVNYVRTGILGQVMWYHPHLRDIVVFVSGELFGGYSAWGLRFGSICFGSMTVPMLGYLALSLTGSRLAGCAAAFFLCIDPLHIALSRQAFQESTTPFLIVSAVLATVRAVRRDELFWCYLAGLLFGLASASKWHGLFPWAVSAAAYVAAPWLVRNHAGENELLKRSFTALAAFGAVPVVVYAVVYIPWILRGYSLGEFLDFQLFLVKRQYSHHASAYAEAFLSMRAYQWFLWPTAWSDFVLYQGKPYLTVAMGNFLVWVLTIPSVLVCSRAWLRERTFGRGFAVALFLVSYLPLVLTKRGIWVFSAPAVIPFAFILSAWVIADVVQRGKIPKKAVAAYAAGVMALSALMYPMTNGRTLEYAYLTPVALHYSPHQSEHFRER